ncbi:SPOR domain-containing protein [Aurantibacter sp.]|uniref:SPOR domain-containing protein n=1 Tax=Aurantibacter sp. TaxID=2807103 RepID=UPI003264C232
MKILLYTAILFGTLGTTYAQTGKVNIVQDQKLDKLLTQYKTANSSSEYYRIQVGFGSHAKATRIKSEVEVDFPNLYSKIDFDSPTYRVRVGRFKNKLDAERKFIEVRAKYPDAMLLKPKKSSN